jgi:putative transposase
MNNNKMERFNGEVRDREKVMRGLKRNDTTILTGYQIYHNYIREHKDCKVRLLLKDVELRLKEMING